MSLKNNAIAVAFALIIGMGGLAASAQTAVRKCNSEECACEKALQKNTVEALENFLRKYPQAENGSSACAALAVPDRNDETTAQDAGEPTKTSGSQLTEDGPSKEPEALQ